ncbi:MAG: transketolase C-terminal domain-containing protein, partial [Catalinimonas sp.]
GMGVWWADATPQAQAGRVEILDLRTLEPLDWAAVVALTERHGKVLVLCEEPLRNSFAEALAGRIAQACFQSLDAPVATLGAADLPAVPLNLNLERAMLPNAERVGEALARLLSW